MTSDLAEIMRCLKRLEWQFNENVGGSVAHLMHATEQHLTKRAELDDRVQDRSRAVGDACHQPYR